MTGKPSVRGEVNVALNRLVREGVLESFKSNFGFQTAPTWVPEITVTIPETADLASVLEQVDAAVKPMGPVMLIWARTDEAILAMPPRLSFSRSTLMTVVKGEINGFAPGLQHGFGHHLDGQHWDGMGLETTVDQALIRGLGTARP